MRSPARLRLSPTQSAEKSPAQVSGRVHGRPATVAYAFSIEPVPARQINEYSTVPADNGSLVGRLTLPTPYDALQIATDLSGRIYVAACTNTGPVEVVFVFSPHSTGTDAPTSTIEMGACDLIDAIAVDPGGSVPVC